MLALADSQRPHLVLTLTPRATLSLRFVSAEDDDDDDDDDDDYVRCVAQLVERRSLAGELTLSCARPSADGDHYVGNPSAEDQPTRPTQPFILSGSINE